jgi:hypothetical protein
MMVLMGFSFSKVLLGMLFVSLIVLFFIIVYKKILVHLGKGSPIAADYCVLYTIEQNPVLGQLEMYFTTNTPKKVTIEILDQDMNVLVMVADKDFAEGGHIVRFDSRGLPNGHYFYGLRTDNQKTRKKMEISNPV